MGETMIADQTATVDWSEVTRLLDTLYAASSRLEELFPGRKFTLDGHLVGSIGEVIAAYMFDLELGRASTLGHDAMCRAGRKVEIKFTQGRSVAIRHESEHLLVLHRPKNGRVRVVFNGPGLVAWGAAGSVQSNGQRPISLSKLATLDSRVSDVNRLSVLRDAPV